MKIKTVPITTQSQPYATLYQSFLSKGLNVPKPLELTTASAPLFHVYQQILSHYFNHDGLSPLLMGCIRYTVAFQQKFDACIELNKDILALHGISDLSSLEREEPPLALEDKDVAIYRFAIDSLLHPERITEDRISEMNQRNVTDSLLFDAAFHGALLLMMGPLVKSFG